MIKNTQKVHLANSTIKAILTLVGALEGDLTEERRAFLVRRLNSADTDGGSAPAPAVPERILSAREAAERFGCSPRTLANWSKLGLLRPFKPRGRVRGRGYRLSDVENLLSGRAA